MPGCPAGDVTQQQFFANTNWQMADAKLLPPPFIPDLVSSWEAFEFTANFRSRKPSFIYQFCLSNFLIEPSELRQNRSLFPFQNGANDIQNFDKEFTEAEPALTPVEESLVSELNHDLFSGFDYTNPNMTNWPAIGDQLDSRKSFAYYTVYSFIFSFAKHLILIWEDMTATVNQLLDSRPLRVPSGEKAACSWLFSIFCYGF